MTKPMIRIHNAETDEIIDREMTDDEFGQYQNDQKELAKLDAALAHKAVEKASLLNRLGITEEELQSILG